MATKFSRTHSEQMLNIVRTYLDTGGTEPIDLEDLARFAMVFDFRQDLAELEQPTDYRPKQSPPDHRPNKPR